MSGDPGGSTGSEKRAAPEGTGVTWGLRPIEGGPSELPLVPGRAQELAPGVVRVLAPNADLMTGPGTNTYVVGGASVLVIDPGPDDEAHFEAVEQALAGRPVAGVLASHYHSDHAPGAKPLAGRLGAPFMAYPGRLEPDVGLAEGMTIPGIDEEVRVLHTPGHSSDHVCLLLVAERMLFSGDHVMGGSTVVIAPPDGDMADYMASIERLYAMDLAVVMPGHGQPVYDPARLLGWYLEHRRERENQVVAALSAGPRTIGDMVAELYADVPKAAHPVAAMSVLAHLQKLEAEGRAVCAEGEGTGSAWRLSS